MISLCYSSYITVDSNWMDSKLPALSTWQASRPAGPISAAPNGEQRIAFQDLVPALIQFIGTLPLPDGDHESMLSYDFFLGEHLMAAWLPGVQVVPAPVKPAPPAAGAGAGTVEIYRQATALCAAYKANTNAVKAILIWEVGDMLTQLHQGYAGLTTRTPAELFAAAYEQLGTLTEADALTLRNRTKEPLDPGMLASVAIARRRGLYQKLGMMGQTYIPSPHDMFSESIVIFSDAHPKIKEMIDKYCEETPLGAARTFENLCEVLTTKLSRHPEPVYVSGQLRRALANATTDNETHAVSAAVGTKTVTELQAFYDAAPVAQYCWVHGYGNHSSAKCRAMVNAGEPRGDYTQEHICATRPTKINGKGGNSTITPGYRIA